MERITQHGQGKSLNLRHAVAVCDNQIYLYGGADQETRTNDIYCFNPSKIA